MSTATLSDRKFAANRANAQRSTGPTTDAGKQRTRLNALRHGFFAKSLLLPGDDPSELEQLKADFLTRLNPRDALELRTADSIIANHWRLARLRRAECRLLIETEQAIEREHEEAISRLLAEISILQQSAKDEQVRVSKAPSNRKRKEAQAALDDCLSAFESKQEALDAIRQPPRDRAIVRLLENAESRAGYDAIQRHIRQIENGLNRSMRQLRELRKEELPDELNSFTRDALEQLNANRCEPAPAEVSDGEMDNDASIGLDVSEDVPAASDAQSAADDDPPAAGRADAGGGDSQNVRNEPTVELVRGAQVDFGSQGDGQFDPLRR